MFAETLDNSERPMRLIRKIRSYTLLSYLNRSSIVLSDFILKRLSAYFYASLDTESDFGIDFGSTERPSLVLCYTYIQSKYALQSLAFGNIVMVEETKWIVSMSISIGSFRLTARNFRIKFRNDLGVSFLMIETVSISETSVSFCETTWYNVPEDGYLHIRHVRSRNVINTGFSQWESRSHFSLNPGDPSNPFWGRVVAYKPYSM
jgi:hypothetical protein